MQEIRTKYPQYGDMADADLVNALHAKHYSDMPREEFNNKIGYQQDAPKQEHQYPDSSIPQGLIDASVWIDKNLGRPARGLTAGVAQGVEHGIASIANLPLQMLGTENRVPYVDFAKHFLDDPKSKVAFYTGDIGGSLAGGAGVASKVAKGIGYLDKGRKLAPLASDALTGALTGFATGAQSQDDMAGRLFGAGAGAFIPTAVNVGKSRIGKRVLEREATLGKEMANAYDKVFDSIDDKGLLNRHMFGKVKNIKYDAGTPKEVKHIINKFANDPTFQNAHKAQSELATLTREHIRDLGAKASKQGRKVLDSEEVVTQQMERYRKVVQDAMEGYLNSQNAAHLANDYKDVGRRYAQEYSRYLDPAIQMAKSGKISKARMVSELQDKTKSMYNKGLYSEIKGYDTREKLEPLIKLMKATGAVSVAGTPLMYLAKQIFGESAAPIVEKAIYNAID